MSDGPVSFGPQTDYSQRQFTRKRRSELQQSLMHQAEKNAQ